MNCNPFTYGHLHLIRQALQKTDFLIIFVVEEDKSFFSFAEHFVMVSKGVADLENVMVVLSGSWKNGRLHPVVTVVVYFRAEEWDGSLSQREMYADCSEEILRFAADYRINLITPNGLSDSEIDEFQSNMR